MNLTGIFQEIMKLSLMGTVLIVLLLGIKMILKGQLSARWHYTVWFLVILRLALPIAPEYELSLYNVFKPVMNDVQYMDTSIKSPLLTQEMQVISEKSEEEANESETIATEINLRIEENLTLMDILALIWLLGAGTMIFVTLVSNIRFYKKIRYSVPCRDPLSLKVLEDCYDLASVKRHVPLYLNEFIKVPLLFGIAKPRIILSEQVLKQLSQEQKRYIFLHELIHFKRMDILVNWLIAFLRCLYWFNPVIHYAFYKMREDCEISCDENVLKKLKPTEYHRYGETIINLVSMFSEPCTLASTSSLIQKKSSVKRRIHMISKFKQKTAIGTLMTLVLTVFIGCSALTNVKNDVVKPIPTPSQTTTVQPGQPSESPTKVNTSETNTPQPSGQDQGQGQGQGQGQTVEEKVQFNLDKLKDQSYTGTYGEGQPWYTAAEDLGMLGKPAIPGLIEKLETKDDYERTLAIYALLLATQHENVKTFTQGEYIEVNLDFNVDSHPEMVEKARAWWNKYKGNF